MSDRAPPHPYALYQAARARIQADACLMADITAAAGGRADALVEAIAQGEMLFAADRRFSLPKSDREQPYEAIIKAATDLASALKAAGHDDVFLVQRSEDQEALSLVAYLTWLVDIEEDLKSRLPFSDHYPPGQSRGNYEGFMLRHVKSVVTNWMPALACRNRAAFIANIAAVVLNNPNIDEQTIHKLK